MDRKQLLAIAVVLAASAAMLTGVLRSTTPAESRSDLGRGAARSVGALKGPHGGRLLTDGDFALEVTIFERGVPPEFRVYCFDHERPIDSVDVTLTIELHRLGGRVDVFEFTNQEDYLRGNGMVEEPHSFDVTVVAQRHGRTHRWTYPSYEGRVSLTPEAIRNSGLVIETAGPATLNRTLTVYGRIVPNADLQAHVIPRYHGVVKAVRKRLGDPVAAGEVVAMVQSNESLQPYEVCSPIAGIVVHKDVTPDEFVPEGEAIYTVADLSAVWADLHVYQHDLSHLRLGQPVTIHADERLPEVTSTISYLAPFGAAATQTLLVRVELPNPTGAWRPGWFVTGEILVEEVTVPLAVKLTALQTFREWDVVFMNEGNVFEVRPLELGRRDAEWVEVIAGLTSGQRYAADNSFIIKADIGKSGATHDH